MAIPVRPLQHRLELLQHIRFFFDGMPAPQYTIEQCRSRLPFTSKPLPLRIREEGPADIVLWHFHHKSVDTGDLFCNFYLGFDRDGTFFNNRAVERHFYDPIGLFMGSKEALSNVKNDCFTQPVKLVVMLAIGSRAANYIKLVSEGHFPFMSTHKNMDYPMINLIVMISRSVELY